jgi:hypothetical protein
VSPARPERRDPAAALRSRSQRDRPAKAPVRTDLRTEPIKATFDMPPALYRKVKMWSAEHEITVLELTKRLFAEMLTDEKLAQHIRDGGQDTVFGEAPTRRDR